MNEDVMKQRMEDCIQNCWNCYQICVETRNYCLEKGGEHANPSHISTLTDCIEMCKMATDFMLRNSDFHIDICGICADACDRCAESCESRQDPQMQACADMCRTCQESCEEMSSESAE